MAGATRMNPFLWVTHTAGSLLSGTEVHNFTHGVQCREWSFVSLPQAQAWQLRPPSPTWQNSSARKPQAPMSIWPISFLQSRRDETINQSLASALAPAPRQPIYLKQQHCSHLCEKVAWWAEVDFLEVCHSCVVMSWTSPKSREFSSLEAC